MGKRVLFISHDATRTGAPLILLRMLRWLRAHSSLSFDVLLRNGGELRDEFAQVADVFDAGIGASHRRFRLFSRRGRSRGGNLVDRLSKRDLGLVYSNTITNGELLRTLAPLDCPVITHVHELEHWIRWETPSDGLRAVREHTDHFIAVSEAVRDNLVRNVGVPADKVEVIYEFIPVAEVRRHHPEEAKQALCDRLGIPRSARLVAGCGTTDWRKGPDLLIQVAAAVRRRGLPLDVHFLWIGGDSSGPSWGKLVHDAAKAGVADRVHFLGVQKDPFPLFAALDVFLLTSREDPFPLVMLENAAAGKPIVCFQRSGGAQEFVGSDCGLSVPYLDIEAMAAAVRRLLDNQDLRQQMGIRAAEKARNAHDMDVGGARICKAIERFLPSAAKRAHPPAAIGETSLPTSIASDTHCLTGAARRLIAFYLPQYHPIPENDQWWGKGFTEWTNVTKARPLFAGHCQPHLPADLGYYDLRLPEVREAQAELAREYGIEGFCYYHYWFGGRRLLERPFQEVLQSGRPDFPFCLCWANENWSRNWDGGHRETLLEQDYSREDDRRHIEWLLGAFSDPRYLRIDDRPLLLIYRAKHLPDARRTTELWREAARQRGFKGLYLCCVESCMDPRENPALQGFDAAVEFQPDWLQLGKPINSRRKRWLRRWTSSRPGPEGPIVYDYASVVQRMLAKPDAAYRRFPCVMPSWDNTSRRGRSGTVLRGSTPELYEHWLTEVLRRPLAGSRDENLVFVNAWNEWAEGNHLEPDTRFGRGYLEATRRAIQVAGTTLRAPMDARRTAA
jgi:glycosyltransferase involved in cell wall biosynthesis